MFQEPKTLIYSRRRDDPLERRAIHYNLMTDLVGSFNVPLPAGKNILLETTVLDDGIGDLIHQIRVYQCLNQLYPGQIITRTTISGSNVKPIQDAAKDYNFICSELLSDVEKNNVVLRFTISNVNDGLKLNLGDTRSFDLNEISDAANSLRNVNSWFVNGYFGLLPCSEGIWYENPPKNSDKTKLLESVSEKFKKGFWFFPEVEVEPWLSQTWILESHFYGMNKFSISLFAQLIYLKNNPNMQRCVIKLHGKNRDAKLWIDSVVAALQDDQYSEILAQVGLGKIFYQDLDGINRTVITDENGRIDLYLVRVKLDLKDYAIFKQLINGMVCPSGDNSYCDALSNGNAFFPPLMELRDYKLKILTNLCSVISALDIPDSQKKWLKEFFSFSSKLFTLYVDENENEYARGHDSSDIIKYSVEFGKLLLENPTEAHQAWQSLHAELAHHDISKRLPAIVKEQLLFQQFPELIKVKLALINNDALSVQEKLNQYDEAIQTVIPKEPSQDVNKCK